MSGDFKRKQRMAVWIAGLVAGGAACVAMGPTAYRSAIYPKVEASIESVDMQCQYLSPGRRGARIAHSDVVPCAEAERIAARMRIPLGYIRETPAYRITFAGDNGQWHRATVDEKLVPLKKRGVGERFLVVHAPEGVDDIRRYQSPFVTLAVLLLFTSGGMFGAWGVVWIYAALTGRNRTITGQQPKGVQRVAGLTRPVARRAPRTTG